MKIKKSRLKTIILEEINSYAADIKSHKLLVESSQPENQKLIKKIEDLYFKKFGKKMEPPSEMEKERARQEMDKDGTYLLWRQPDDINKFRWIAYHYIMGTDVEEMTSGDIDHFARRLLPRLGSKTFHYYLRGVAGSMINMFPWRSSLKPYTPKDRTEE